MKLLVCFQFVLALVFALEEERLTKSFHKTIDVDDIESISAMYPDDSQIEALSWEGNVILVEVNVVAHNTSAAVFNYFEKNGRYETLTSVEGGKLILSPKTKKQQSVMVKGAKKETFEEVSIKIMVPSEFKKSGENEWVRESSF